ncbi:MAG: type II toxin-antitoxin system VapC family toxin [Spirochaetota bacterium]
MILLDTNYLIGVLVKDSLEAERVRGWLRSEDLCTTAIAWYEFLSGPVTDEGIALVSAVLRDRILPYSGDQAQEGARLWNATGRIRRLRIDAMIAGAAVVTGAALATSNLDDFEPFRAYGLQLVPN